ncbi:MAG: hemolysin III family protein [Pseudomonadota bacterium]
MFPSPTAPERTADFIIHAVSLVGFAIASVFLISTIWGGGNTALVVAVGIYATAALFSISISFAYHLLPRHDLRPLLRRWDHAAIYPVIAGTFTPLLITAGTLYAHVILAIIWVFAGIGIAFKVVTSDMDSRWSLVSYLGLGWFALFALPSFWSELPRFSTYAIAAGGLFYTIGTLFYRRKGMPYRYPIWHGFGTLGGTSLFAAIWVAVAG